VPVDQEGRAWVRYGERDPGQYVPAREVLAGTVEAGRLDGHVVFVGASAAGLGDIKAAPIVGTMPGVEIQASLLQTLLSGSILRRPVRVVQLENVALLVLGLILA
jgi:adenylate cyclase